MGETRQTGRARGDHDRRRGSSFFLLVGAISSLIVFAVAYAPIWILGRTVTSHAAVLFVGVLVVGAFAGALFLPFRRYFQLPLITSSVAFGIIVSFAFSALWPLLVPKVPGSFTEKGPGFSTALIIWTFWGLLLGLTSRKLGIEEMEVSRKRWLSFWAPVALIILVLVAWFRPIPLTRPTVELSADEIPGIF